MSYSLLSHHSQHSFTIDGYAATTRAIRRLLEDGMEFHVEPLPDNQWDITVKAEDATRMSQINDAVTSV